MFFFNALLVDESKGRDTYLWNASSDELLEGLARDWYSWEVVAVDNNGFVKRREIYVNVGGAGGDKEDWKDEAYAVLLADGDVLTLGHGSDEEAMKGDSFSQKFPKLGATFQFDSSGKLKLRDDFYRATLFKTRSEVDPGPRRCTFEGGAVEAVNLVEPVSVLWSTRRWDADAQTFKSKLPAEDGYSVPFEFVITKGKKLVITAVKKGGGAVVWEEEPNYQDWAGRF